LCEIQGQIGLIAKLLRDSQALKGLLRTLPDMANVARDVVAALKHWRIAHFLVEHPRRAGAQRRRGLSPGER